MHGRHWVGRNRGNNLKYAARLIQTTVMSINMLKPYFLAKRNGCNVIGWPLILSQFNELSDLRHRGKRATRPVL